MPNCSANPNPLIPYTIPKFTAFAAVLCSFVTSSSGTSNTFDATCLWISSSFKNASVSSVHFKVILYAPKREFELFLSK